MSLRVLKWFEAKVSKRLSNSVNAARRLTWLVLTAALFAAAALAQIDGAAKVIAMSGRVTVMRGSPWVLAEGETIRPLETIRTGPDGSAKFQVSDGSTFDVYPNSEVVFRANPGSLQDLVDVFLGKIKVKIEHYGNVPNHNTVRTPTAVIAVRGTIFDVDVSGTDETTQVLCEEGRVEVSHLTQPGNKRILEAGESVTVFKNQPLAKNSVDRGAVMQKVFRAMSDTVDQILLRRSSGGTTGTGSGTTTTSSGDKGGTPAPTGGTPPPTLPPPH
jgi:ferric-dicitrate binding protein FerR (iron transport regulator)